MKKLLVLMLTILIGTIILSACGNKEDAVDENTNTETNEKTERLIQQMKILILVRKLITRSQQIQMIRMAVCSK